MTKRWRKPTAKQGELKVAYGKLDRWSDPDIIFCWGPGTSGRDSRLLHLFFGTERPRTDYSVIPPRITFDKSMLQELEARGYDLTTLKFSIQKKKDAA